MERAIGNLVKVDRRLACWTALPLLLACASAAQAADTAAAAVQVPTPTVTTPATGAQPGVVNFSADSVSYDDNSQFVIAEGRVRMARDGYYLSSDRIEWNQRSGEVVAIGNVVVLSPEGDRIVGERVVLDDSLRDGTVENLLVVLDGGGRLAARSATRTNGVLQLEQAIYSPCATTGPTGCPRKPSWSITAARVTRDPVRGRLRFEGGRLNLLGLTLPLLPVFNISDGSNNQAASGILIPNLSVSNSNGVEIGLPYYLRLAENRDLTITPHVYSKVLPAFEARWRHLTTIGAYQLGGFVTHGKVDRVERFSFSGSETESRRGFRGYFEGNGRFQFNPLWSLTSSFRVATDKTVTRRYDITRDDRLRSFVDLERITPNSYISIAGWAFQGLLVDDVQRQFPIALPALDARFRLDDPLFGGRVELQANSLAILRIDGQDTQRAFASARWEKRRLTRLGQELTLTAYGRGDVYHSSNSRSNRIPFYRGEDGWHGRAIGAIAADARWPLIGSLFGGTQRLTPRVQLVLTPPTRNLPIPNEDARSVDLEDSNLFALNRFPGYDRWEDGSRVTYGTEWSLDRNNWSFNAIVGQSYRLTREPSLFPDGTGLTDRFSDVVGRSRLRYGRLFDLTHRYRLDKDNLAVRRNEVDLTVGTEQTYLQIGYLRLDRDISRAIEDLRDKEELRVAGRLKFLNYWSLFAATVFDLTSSREDPRSGADGFRPVRLRMGLNYEDDCLELGVSWRRDYEQIGEFRKGSTLSFSINLKGLGR
ncbi:MAG TPA: LPS assembly protein LptD [Sphingomicrobium sp.]|nr:LPS assembly protein LptD [Sphingomicrobium sp.]